MSVSVWKKNEVLELDFCRISRAAQLLQCDPEDIIHWASNNHIQLCIKACNIHCDLLIPSLGADEKNLFIVEMMLSNKQNEFISKGSKYIKPNPLVSIYLDKIFDLSEEAEIEKFSSLMMEGRGYPVAIDGLWGIDNRLFDNYDINTPPALGDQISPEYSMAIKALEVLSFQIPDSTSNLISNSSFILKSPDDDDIFPDFIAMVGVMDKPNNLNLENIYITKKQIDKIHYAISAGGWENNSAEELKPKITKKQSSVTVALFRKIGITDADMGGSITELRRKVSRLAPEVILPDDDKSIIEWLKKGGINR
ncbi:MAG: hypothetical protein XXXJIFNMEKO3_00605 [Candidatus Erwinia impunctatus]|nr:hypothetical protein XXXJIFNMEKO_00605 [Culicoides impunctatus]